MPPQTLRVGIHQAPPGSGLGRDVLANFSDQGARVVVLPEYFWVRPDDRDHVAAASHMTRDLEVLASVSRDVEFVLVGGTLVEEREGRFHNACPVFHRGVELGRYRKIHLMPGEARTGLSPGDGFVVVSALDLRLAPVVCADVLYPDTFAQVAQLGSDLILAPMSSPHRPDEPRLDKEARDTQIFVEGARRAGAPIVKVGSPGPIFGRPLQGRSLVATPRGILFRTPFEDENATRSWVVEVPLASEGG